MKMGIEMLEVKIDTLRQLCIRPLISAGLSKLDANAVFCHLLEEELLGKHSHGFIRMPSILKAVQSFTGESKVVAEETATFASRMIFHNTLGLVAASKVTERTIEIAKTNGISMVAGIGYTGTTGALGYYGRMIAAQNLIGVICCSSEYAVAPWGGKDAILGTNPIAIAITNGDSPIISDFATAAMTYGDLMLAVKEKRKVPYGVVLDSNGNPSHNPEDANNGSQLPMAQHKGYALGLAVEVLAGLFIGAKAGKEAVRGSDGILMIAFKPELFIPEEEYRSHLNALITEIKSSSLAQNSKGIRIPGENSVKKINDGFVNNICQIPETIYNDLLNL